MTINKNNIIIVICLLIILILGIIVTVQYFDNKNIEEEIGKRVKAETIIEIKEKERGLILKERDSLNAVILAKNQIIEYQKNNVQTIIHESQIIHNNIDQLSKSEQYELFTDNIRDYKANRNRYSLSRFKQ